MAGNGGKNGALVARGLAPEILRAIFSYLPVKTLKNVSLSCSLFRQIAAEFAFSRCVVPLHCRNGLDVARMKRIMLSDEKILACVRDFAIVLDMASVSDGTKEREVIVGAVTLEKQREQREQLRCLAERLSVSRLRSVSISRHLILDPETVFDIPKLFPHITHLSLRSGRLVENLESPQHPLINAPFAEFVDRFKNLQHLSLDLRQRRIGANVSGAIHIPFELISRNSTTLQSLAVEIDAFRRNESSDRLQRLLRDATADTAADPKLWESFISQRYTVVPTQLPALRKLQLRGLPYLHNLNNLFAQNVWRPASLTALRLDLCRYADEFLVDVAQDLTALKCLAVCMSCEWRTLSVVLPALPPLDKLFLKFKSPSETSTDSFDVDFALRVHRASLRTLWFECVPNSGRMGQLLSKWIESAMVRMPRLEELAVPEAAIWPEFSVVSTKVLQPRSPRILRVLSTPRTFIEESYRNAITAATVSKLVIGAPKFNGRLRLPKLQLVVFGTWSLDQTVGATEAYVPRFWRVAYKAGEGGGGAVPVVERVGYMDAMKMFPRSAVLNFDAGEREWADVVDS